MNRRIVEQRAGCGKFQCAESGVGQAHLEQRQPVVAPERLAAEEEDRDAEDVIVLGLAFACRVRVPPGAGEKSMVDLRRDAELGEEGGDRLGLVELELAREEAAVRLGRVAPRSTPSRIAKSAPIRAGSVS